MYDKSVEVYVPFVVQVENEEDGNKIFNPAKILPYAVNLKEELLVKKWIKDNAEVIELWDQASLKPYFWRQYEVENNELAKLKMPNLGKYRIVLHMLAWDAYFQTKEGDFEKVSKNMFILYKAGMHLKNQKTIIEQLVGLGYLSVANETLCRILNNYQVDENELTIIQNQLVGLFESIDFHTSFEADLYFMLDEIQRMFVTTRFGDHLYFKNVFQMEVGDVGEDDTAMLFLYSLRNLDFGEKILRHPDKKQTIEDAIALYESAVKYAKVPPYQDSDYMNQLMKIIKSNLVLNILMPAFDALGKIGYKGEVDTEATIVILAAHIYEIKEGFWPESLNELVCNGYLEQMPIDPFSGKPLVYCKQDDSFLLYSVGYDKIDNGGKIEYKGEGKKVLWSKENGYDAVFWPVD